MSFYFIYCIVSVGIFGLHVTSPSQTKKLSILLSFYFHEVLQYLNTFT